jgi:hypothetical protein
VHPAGETATARAPRVGASGSNLDPQRRPAHEDAADLQPDEMREQDSRIKIAQPT